MVILVLDASRGDDRLVGRLTLLQDGPFLHGVEMTYHPNWLRDGYALGPGMPLVAGPQTFASMPGPLGDAGPDRWGRSLLSSAPEASRQPLTHDGDFLLAAPDTTRQGALRLADSAEPDLHLGSPGEVPGLWSLERVYAAVERFEDHAATDEDLDVLLRAGSSPGGARPKAVLRGGDGDLRLAKFPRGDDRWDVMAWEATMLELARRAGLAVPSFELRRLSPDRSMLVMSRFDRGGTRLAYLSARSMLGHDAATVAPASYASIAHAQAPHVADRGAAARALVRVAALRILVNDVDDHTRNLGYIRSASGWEPSPVFDINPFPFRQQAMPVSTGGEQVERDVRELVERAQDFGLDRDTARTLVLEASTAVSTWPEVAEQMGISDPDEHSIMERATAFAAPQVQDLARAVVAVGRPGHRATTSPIEAQTRSLGSDGATWVEPHVRGGRHVAGHWRQSRTL